MGILDALLAYKEKRRLSRSLVSPIIRPYRRDSFRYYENGRSVTIYAEMMFGQFHRVIDRSCSLKWNDTQTELMVPEREKIFASLLEYFRRRKIRWKDISA